jgi:hypothetical protein
VAAEELVLVAHVVLRFVRDPRPATIDDAVAGVRLLHDREPRHRIVRRPHRRAPPGTVHESHVGADLESGADSVARIARDRRTPLGPCRLRQVLLPHRLVVLETARGQDHATSRLDQALLAVTPHQCSDHAAVPHDQRLEGCFEPQRQTPVEHRPAQTRDTGAAVRKPA